MDGVVEPPAILGFKRFVGPAHELRLYALAEAELLAAKEAFVEGGERSKTLLSVDHEQAIRFGLEG